jgi:SpoVK/Ycf46/Vps4 family AAA+-type ATPase
MDEKEKKNQVVKTITGIFTEELEQRFRAGYPAIFIRSFEEKRALMAIKEACDSVKNSKGQPTPEKMYVWDCRATQSSPESPPMTKIREYTGRPDEEGITTEIPMESDLVPTYASAVFSGNTVLVVLDFHFYLGEDVHIIRSIKNSLPTMTSSGKCLIFLGPRLTNIPNVNIPEELEKDICVMDFPLPGREELRTVLNYVLLSASESTPDKKTELTELIKDKLCDAALGLTAQEAEDLFSLSLAKNHQLTSDSVKIVLDGKCDVIKRDGILEYFSPEITLEDVGGLKELKRWLIKRIPVFTKEARAWGLPYPKGILMVGVQGCGKSLVAKMIAALFGVPLLRLDMGKVFQKFMGQSEGTVRKSISIAEAVSPCVLWIDEIEKGFSGTKSSGETDSGVTNRVVQTYLTWMQEKTSPVFIAATGNNVSQLPPELMRKGRMDEIFFVDLPNPEERREIIKIHIKKRPKQVEKKGKSGAYTLVYRTLSDEDVEKIVVASNGYTGSEIEQAIINALFDKYEERVDPTGDDIVNALKDFVPLSKTMEIEITELRKWGNNKAKSASNAGKYVASESQSAFRRVQL